MGDLKSIMIKYLIYNNINYIMGKDNLQEGDKIIVKDGINVGDITAESALVKDRKLLDADSLKNLHGEKGKVVGFKSDLVIFKLLDTNILQDIGLQSNRFYLSKKHVKRIN